MVRVAMVRFVLLSLGTLVAVGVGTGIVSRHIAADEAMRDAQSRSEGMARGLTAPLVNRAFRAGEPQAVQKVSTALENQIRAGSVRHVELWDPSGVILWADDPALLGAKSPLPRDLLAATAGGHSVVNPPEEQGEHPGRGAGEDDLLEVYVGAKDADGEPFIFEAYVPSERVKVDQKAILAELLPMSLGALLLLAMAMLPLAFSLARRVDRANAHRSGILNRSLLSWHEERRRLAQGLHDGVIQDLSAMSYALEAVVDQVPDTASAAAAKAAGRRMQDILVQNVRDLRTMLIDLAPAGLEGDGLRAALEGLPRRSDDDGPSLEVHVAEDLRPTPALAGLAYRIVREGFRNAEKHSGARAVRARVDRDGDRIVIRVTDDGKGLQGAVLEDGHVGLQLLQQLVTDVGGTLSLSDASPRGAELHAVIPATPPDLEPAERPVTVPG